MLNANNAEFSSAVRPFSRFVKRDLSALASLSVLRSHFENTFNRVSRILNFEKFS